MRSRRKQLDRLSVMDERQGASSLYIAIRRSLSPGFGLDILDRSKQSFPASVNQSTNRRRYERAEVCSERSKVDGTSVGDTQVVGG